MTDALHGVPGDMIYERNVAKEIVMAKELKLSKVRLSGFKSYGDTQEISLKAINILIGANGSGKSNFVSFLEMISFISTGGFRNYVARNGFARSILYHGIGINEKISGSLIKCMSYRYPVSSMIDLFRLPVDFPGYGEAE